MSEPDCQCSLMVTQPSLLVSQVVPQGFCGHCEVCGGPGHTRHFPGAAPTTGTWCDRHYRRLLWLHPMGRYGRRIYWVVIVGALVAYTVGQT